MGSSENEADGSSENEGEREADSLEELVSRARSVTPSSPTSLHLITKLDLSDCNLSSLPSDLPNVLPQLSILFLSNNHFTEWPSSVLHRCLKLQMIAFRNNGMTSIKSASESSSFNDPEPRVFPPALRWLILTNNRLTALPESLGIECPLLQKCMLSGNQLTHIPVSIGSHCHQLELLRLASNQLQEIPSGILSQCPKLAWLAVADNPCLPDVPSSSSRTDATATIPVTEPLVDILGTGAGGTTYRSERTDTSEPVAVKVPPNAGTMTSDGKPAMEHAVHAYISPTFVQQQQGNGREIGICPLLGRRQNGPGVVLPLLEHIRALAGPPSLTSCTRDVYDTSTQPTMPEHDAQAILTSILDVVYTLHTELRVAHGDIYAHNILVSIEDSSATRRRPLLTDWGAAFYYGPERQTWLERIELRAVAVLAEELNCPQLAEQCRLPTATVDAVHVWWMQQTRLPNMAQQFTDSLGEGEDVAVDAGEHAAAPVGQ